jgi:hypothetical protein
MPRGHYKRTPEQIARMVAGKNLPTALERFWNTVDVKGPDECWTWTGSVNPRQYGYFHVGGCPKRGDRKRVAAHRFSWELHHKVEIPAGLVIDHMCKNTRCVNPSHIRAVLQADNCVIFAKETSCFRRNKMAKACPKGHAYTPENIAISIRGGRKCRVCLACFPGNWRRALIPRPRPAGALTPEQYEKRFGRRDPSA